MVFTNKEQHADRVGTRNQNLTMRQQTMISTTTTTSSSRQPNTRHSIPEVIKKKKRKHQKPTSHLLHRHKTTTTPATPAIAKSLPSKLSKKVINSHHTLQKRLSQAQLAETPDSRRIETLQKEISSLGGIERYQYASLNGQSSSRGGDSSRILVQWLKDHHMTAPITKTNTSPRLLEVGCLCPTNASTTCGIFGSSPTRIDLNSLHPSIQECDFMEFPISNCEQEKYDMISLSLVLNYVPTPIGRGEMLKRTTQFLRTSMEYTEIAKQVLPGLFLVLPSPCVLNSRYLDEQRLTDMMVSLGYTFVERKLAKKLVYYLWRYEGSDIRKLYKTFKKEEINPGGGRNNFAIVIE